MNYAHVVRTRSPRARLRIAVVAQMNPTSDSTTADLAGHCLALTRRTLAELFATDPDRFARLSFGWDDWLVDLSKERLGPETLPLLVAHADAIGLPGWIAALFAGEKVNQSEHRPALHTALARSTSKPSQTPAALLEAKGG